MIFKFTDGNGATTHGIAVSIYEEVNTESSLCMKDFAKALLQLRASRNAARRISHWWKAVKPAPMNRRQPRRRKRSSLRALTSLLNIDSSGELSITSDNDDNGTAVTNVARKQGKESYQAMIDTDALGERLLVERCYVMIRGNQSEQFLHLKLLQNMIQQEQEVSIFICLRIYTCTSRWTFVKVDIFALYFIT